MLGSPCIGGMNLKQGFLHFPIGFECPAPVFRHDDTRFLTGPTTGTAFKRPYATTKSTSGPGKSLAKSYSILQSRLPPSQTIELLASIASAIRRSSLALNAPTPKCVSTLSAGSNAPKPNLFHSPDFLSAIFEPISDGREPPKPARHSNS